jgi:hypothetical protein
MGRRRRLARAGQMRRSGDPAGAVDVLAPMLVDAPDDPAANVEMARALSGLGDPAGAEDHYRSALAISLDYQIVVELAGVLIERRRAGEAEQLVEAALHMTEADPRLDPGEALLVRATLAATEGRTDDARADLDAIEAERRARATTKEYARRLKDRLP